MLRNATIAGATAALILVATGCASGQKPAGKGNGTPVLSPGSVRVSTNSAMPVLRVEAFKSEEPKP